MRFHCCACFLVPFPFPDLVLAPIILYLALRGFGLDFAFFIFETAVLEDSDDCGSSSGDGGATTEVSSVGFLVDANGFLGLVFFLE